MEPIGEPLNSTVCGSPAMVLANEAARRLARGRAGCYTCVGARNGAPYHNGPLAQLAEQLTLNQRVRGSSPRGLTRHSADLSGSIEADGARFLCLTANLTAKWAPQE